MRSGRTARHTVAPGVLKHVFRCKTVPFGDLIDTLLIGGILGAKTLILGTRDRKSHYNENRE